MKKYFSNLILLLIVLVLFGAPASTRVVAQTVPLTPEDPSQPAAGLTQAFTSLTDKWTAPVYPDFPATEPIGSNPDKVIYLTFDDGPDPVWTPQILALLEKYNATGTFYMIGRNARSFPQVVLELAEGGQMLALHGYNHIDLTTLGYGDFALEVNDTRNAIQDAIAGRPDLSGQLTPCLRPPYGAADSSVYNRAYGMNYAISMWHVDTRDWTGLNANQILSTVESEISPYKVVLMHDGGKDRTETVRGLGLVLHELTQLGYSFQPYCTASGQAYNQ